MDTGSKVLLGGLLVGGIALVAAGASAQVPAESACDDAPDVAARYGSREQLRSWLLCMGRTGAQASQCAQLLDAAGRSADATWLRDAWNTRAQLQASAPDGSLSPSGKTAADTAFRTPPRSPAPDPLSSASGPKAGPRSLGSGGGKGRAAYRPGAGKGSAPSSPSDGYAPRSRSAPRIPGRSRDRDRSDGRSEGGSRLADRVAPPPRASDAADDSAPLPSGVEFTEQDVADVQARQASAPQSTGHGHGHRGRTSHERTSHGSVRLPEASEITTSRVSGDGMDDDTPVVRLAGGLEVRPVDRTKARQLAGPLARMLKGAVRGQHATNVRAFQKAAGMLPTGEYDGRTYNALRFYGIQAPPPALYPPDASDPAAGYSAS